MMLESGSYSSSQSKSCLLCVSAVGHQQKAVPHTFKRVAHVRQYRAQSGPPEIQLFEFASAGAHRASCCWIVQTESEGGPVIDDDGERRYYTRRSSSLV
jgi:hypothetical protein